MHLPTKAFQHIYKYHANPNKAFTWIIPTLTRINVEAILPFAAEFCRSSCFPIPGHCISMALLWGSIWGWFALQGYSGGDSWNLLPAPPSLHLPTSSPFYLPFPFLPNLFVLLCCVFPFLLFYTFSLKNLRFLHIYKRACSFIQTIRHTPLALVSHPLPPSPTHTNKKNFPRDTGGGGGPGLNH